MLGKKRIFEECKRDNKRGKFKKNTNNNLFLVSTNANNNNYNDLIKITEEINNYYNMTRSTSLNYVQTKKIKYLTNSFIPCIPFSDSSCK